MLGVVGRIAVSEDSREQAWLIGRDRKKPFEERQSRIEIVEAGESTVARAVHEPQQRHPRVSFKRLRRKATLFT